MPLPSALTPYTWEWPSFDNVTARRVPSGDQAGAELLPFSFETTLRAPVTRFCT